MGVACFRNTVADALWRVGKSVENRFLRGFQMGNGGKFLLKTLTFPHCPQIFPQPGTETRFRFLVYIKFFDPLRQITHFFAVRVFHNAGFKEKKFGLDNALLRCKGR